MRLAPFFASLALLTATGCTDPEATEPTTSSPTSAPSDTDNEPGFWNERFEQKSITAEGLDSTVLAGLEPIFWKSTLLEDGRRGLSVDTGCNEITAFDFIDPDLLTIQASIDTTLKECLEPIDSLESRIDTLLRGPSQLSEGPTAGDWQIRSQDESITLTLTLR